MIKGLVEMLVKHGGPILCAEIGKVMASSLQRITARKPTTMEKIAKFNKDYSNMTTPFFLACLGGVTTVCIDKYKKRANINHQISIPLIRQSVVSTVKEGAPKQA